MLAYRGLKPESISCLSAGPVTLDLLDPLGQPNLASSLQHKGSALLQFSQLNRLLNFTSRFVSTLPQKAIMQKCIMERYQRVSVGRRHPRKAVLPKINNNAAPVINSRRQLSYTTMLTLGTSLMEESAWLWKPVNTSIRLLLCFS